MAFGPPLPAVQAHICVRGGAEAIKFYEAALGARCTFMQLAEDGVRVLHANLEINGGEVMLHDEFPEAHAEVLAPSSLGGTSVAINLNVKYAADVDAAVAQAEAAGAILTMPAANMVWGARYGRIRDPFGHVWAFNASLPTVSGTLP
jgi:PhnB protein